jgi:hypothetical protein
MAQTGFTPIQLYSSSTATNVPLAANLATGELAINITDGKLFYKDNAAAVQVIGWKVVPATAGGTGQTSYAVGDLLYADTTTTLAKLADVATGNALISGGVGVAPSYGKIGLTTHVSGVLPVANGGTNASTASITSFNNITGYSAAGATGTTTTNLVFSTSPSITTPTLVGNATLSTGNVIFSASGKGIQGTTTNNNADTGVVGEYVASNVGNTAVTLTTGVTADLTSISLTAGDWDVQGNVGFDTAATANLTYWYAGVSTVSATLQGGYYQATNMASPTGGIVFGANAFSLPSPVARISLSATTTVYLITNVGFTVAAVKAGGMIKARRVR